MMILHSPQGLWWLTGAFPETADLSETVLLVAKTRTPAYVSTFLPAYVSPVLLPQLDDEITKCCAHWRI